MRVLHIVDNLAIRSGVSSVLMNLYRNIDTTKIQFDFLVMNLGTQTYDSEIKSMGGNIYYVSSPLSFKTLIRSIIETKQFFKTNSERYNIVHLHSPTTINFNLRFAKKYKIKNRIIHSHSTMYSNNKIKSFINSILCANIKKYANIYWACSEKAGEFLYGKDYMKSNRVEVIVNAVDCEKYAFDERIRNLYREELRIVDKYVVGHVATFNSIKNHSFLINVFADICKCRDDIRLVLVGNGVTYNDTVNLIKSRGIEDKVLLLGFRSDISNLMQCFDVFVLPSIKEGLPVVAVEAQASGLPCYLSNSITREVNLGNVEYLDLKNDDWSKAIQRKIINNNRKLTYSIISSSIFNIKTEAKRVQDIYLNMDRKERAV